MPFLKSEKHKSMQLQLSKVPEDQFQNLCLILISIIYKSSQMATKAKISSFSNIQMLCLTFCLLSVAFAAVEYYPAPDITTSTFGPLSKSVIGDKWIGSKRIEDLQITQAVNAQDGLDQTTFTLNVYDNAAANYLTPVTLVEKGKWSYIKGTAESLSCSAIYEETEQVYGLLFFNIAKKQLKIAFKSPFAVIKSYLSPNDPLDKPTLESLATIGQNCDSGVFSSIYYIRQTGDFTGAATVKLPDGWNPVKITEDNKYAISGAKVYKYNEASTTYDSIHSLGSTFDEYDLRVSGGRILVLASTSTFIAEKNSFSVKQSFFILQDKANTVKVVKSISYEGLSNGKSFSFFASPKLTKLGFYYLPLTAASQADVILTGFNIDYTASTTSDLKFDDPAEFVTAAAASNDIFDFNERFIVVRNYLSKVELAFEFVGSQVKKFAARDISGEVDQLSSTQKIVIDPYYNPYLTLIVWMKASNGGFSFKRVSYANYAATVRIKLPPPAPLIKFEMPLSSYAYDFKRFEGLQLGYLYKQDGKTNLLTKILDIGSPENSITYSAIFDVQVITNNGNSNCMTSIQFDVNDPTKFTFYLAKLDSTTKEYSLKDLTTVIGDSVIKLPNRDLAVSDSCDKIRINQNIYYTDALGQYTAVGNDLATFEWISIDGNLVYAYSTGFIWKYNPTTKKYDNIYTFPSGMDHTFKNIYSKGNKIVLYAVENAATDKTFTFSVYRDDNSKITFIGEDKIAESPLNFTIKLSPDLTRVALIDEKPGDTDKIFIKLWQINYASGAQNAIKETKISPSEFYDSSKSLVYILFQNFLYIRQIVNQMNSIKTEKHFIYDLKSATARLIYSKIITPEQKAAYTRITSIITKDNKYYLCHVQQFIDPDTNKRYLLVPYEQFQVGVSNLDEKSQVTGLVKDGKTYLCEPGCTDCSAGTCIGCKAGYVLDTIFSSCKKCGSGCKECDATDINKCSSCSNGLYLSSTSCIACDLNCAACSTTSKNCDSCVAQMFLDTDFSCKACPKYCKECTDATTCVTCRNGFILTAEKKCRSCSILCSECLSNSVITCSSCSNGLELLNGVCVPCPDNCNTCSSGICSQCANGYTLNDKFVCVLACQLSCATCATNLPTVCTSCYGSATLSAGICNVKASCNTDSSCTECGQGLNFYLDSGKCLQCPTINSCLQCNPNDITSCTLCVEGYFVSSAASCSECGLGCKSCTSEAACNVCQPGYILPDTSGICLKCTQPCLTCDSTPSYCTSCMDGYFRAGWKCLPNKYLAVSLTFPSTSDVIAVDAALDELIGTILTSINEDVDNIDIVTILSMLSGSVIVNLAVVPTGGATSTASSSLVATLSAATSFGGLTSGSLSVSVYTATSSVGDSSSGDSNGGNAGMIVGIVIGSVAFVTIVIIIVYCVYKAKKSHLLVHSVESSNIIQDNKESIPVESFNGVQFNSGNGYNVK